MPWSVKRMNKKFCVVKEGETSPISGGCHSSRAEAVDHLRALYASETEAAVSKSYEYEEDDMTECAGCEDCEDCPKDEMSGDTFTFADTMKEYAWEGPIVFENVITGDNRIFKFNSINWQEETLPWAFRWQKASGQGHAGSVPVGRVDRIERKEDGSIYGYGVVIPELSEEAAEYLKMLQTGVGGGVSVDGDSAQFEIQETEGGTPRVEFSSMRLRALSAVDIPAFNGARIHLTDQPVELAASGEVEEDEVDSEEFNMGPMDDMMDDPMHKKMMDSEEEDSEEEDSEEEDSEEESDEEESDEEDKEMKVEISFATKTEDGQSFPSSDYAYVPDPDMPSTWKLRLTSTPGGDPDPQIVGAAIAALGKGFRGNKVQIPSSDLPKVKAKVRAAWIKANPDKKKDEMPEVIQMSEDELVLEAMREELAYKKKKKEKVSGYGWQVDEAIVASAIPVIPSTDAFQDPSFDGPTPLTVTQDGKVFGHLALFNTCHIGFPGTCVKPPKGSKYQYFHTGEIETVEGDLVEVGKLTFKTGHAEMSANPRVAAEHYDNTGAVAADVRAGEDKWGIWVAGALRPHLSDEDIRAFRAAPLSGDWRRIGGKLELVGALSVNVPGFPVPRVKAMVASGETETLFTFIEDDNEEFYPEIERRWDRKVELASKVEKFLGEKLDPEVPEEKLEDLPPLPSKKEIQAAAETMTRAELHKNLKMMRELLDDPDESIPKKQRKTMEDLYALFINTDESGRRTEASGYDLDIIESSGLDIDEWENQLQLSGLGVEEFYNQCHDENGRFCEGPDGPGRVRDKVAVGRHFVPGARPGEPGHSTDPLHVSREHKGSGGGSGGPGPASTLPNTPSSPTPSGSQAYENYRTTRKRALNWLATAAVAYGALATPTSGFILPVLKPLSPLLANPAVLALLAATGVAYATKNYLKARQHRINFNNQIDRKLRIQKIKERNERELRRANI